MTKRLFYKRGNKVEKVLTEETLTGLLSKTQPLLI